MDFKNVLLLIGCGIAIVGLIALWFAVKEMFKELYDLREKVRNSER